MIVFIAGLMLLVSAMSPPTLSCEQLRQMMQGHTLQEVEQMARQYGIPEDVIRDYRRKCHLG
jgi:hypothetical protein